MWFTKEIQDVLKEYDSNEATGLSSQEVKLRLEKYGENKLKEMAKFNFKNTAKIKNIIEQKNN